MSIPSPTASVLGEIGLPAPVSQLASQAWDAIIVGAGHNGLACAAYVARAGKRVLVLESRPRVGGACTIEEPSGNDCDQVKDTVCSRRCG